MRQERDSHVTVETASWPVHPPSGGNYEVGTALYRLGYDPLLPKGAYFTAVLQDGKVAYMAMPLLHTSPSILFIVALPLHI